jgi:hypothetical protein
MNIIETIQTTISGIVGRCYPLTVPEKPIAPYAIYSQVSVIPNLSVQNSISLDNTRLQVDIFAKDYAQCQSLSLLVRAALLALGVQPLSSGDLYESEVKLFRVSQDFSIWS